MQWGESPKASLSKPCLHAKVQRVHSSEAFSGEGCFPGTPKGCWPPFPFPPPAPGRAIL